MAGLYIPTRSTDRSYQSVKDEFCTTIQGIDFSEAIADSTGLDVYIDSFTSNTFDHSIGFDTFENFDS